MPKIVGWRRPAKIGRCRLSLFLWPVGQAVKTAASHAVNMGSIPVRVTNKSGVDCNEDPPVPIPNTEVKLVCADDSAWVTGCENR